MVTTAEAKKTNAAMRPYLVTTAHRGVFFGWANSTDGMTITLHKARNCIHWSCDVEGFLGLASKGPTVSCRIGPAVIELQLRAITSVTLVSDAAAKAWESATWK